MNPNELKNRCVGAIVGFCHRGCAGNAGGVSQPGSDPPVLWQAHLLLYKSSPGACQRILASRLLHRQYPDDAGNRGMPDRMQKDGSGAACGCVALVVPEHGPAPNARSGESESLQAPVRGEAVEQKRRFQQLLRRCDAHDSHRAFLQPFPGNAHARGHRQLPHHAQRTAAPGQPRSASLTSRPACCSPAKTPPGDQVLETADHIAHMDEDLAAVLRWATQIVHLPPEKALFEIGTSSDALKPFPRPSTAF